MKFQFYIVSPCPNLFPTLANGLERGYPTDDRITDSKEVQNTYRHVRRTPVVNSFDGMLLIAALLSVAIGAPQNSQTAGKPTIGRIAQTCNLPLVFLPSVLSYYYCWRCNSNAIIIARSHGDRAIPAVAANYCRLHKIMLCFAAIGCLCRE